MKDGPPILILSWMHLPFLIPIILFAILMYVIGALIADSAEMHMIQARDL